MGFMDGGGPKAFPFETIGDVCDGIVADYPKEVDQTDPATGEVKRWKSGDTRKVWVVNVQTSLRDPANPWDDGMRSLWLRWHSLTAVQNAVRQAGAKDLEPGGRLILQYSANGPRLNPGHNPPKMYQAQYIPPPPAPSGFLDNAQPTEQAGAQPASPISVSPAPTTSPWVQDQKVKLAMTGQVSAQPASTLEQIRAQMAASNAAATTEPPF